MSCFVGVVDHPFFAVTDLNGAFSFPTGLPPGKYVIEATHPKAGSTTQAIEVAAGGGAELELELSIQ